MYTGYRCLNLSEQEFADFYGNPTAAAERVNLLENEYLVVQLNGVAQEYYSYKRGRVDKLQFQTIHNDFNKPIKPRNPEQRCAIDLLLDDSIPVKLLTGQYGAGKDYLMVNAAFEKLKRGVYEKIVYVRNNVEVKDTVPLGALPGSVNDKLTPFLMPLADHVGGVDGLSQLIFNGQIEAQHLGYIRGRDIKNSIILSSEAENLTVEHVQLLLGRVNESSALWLNGDNRQTDKAVFKERSGLKAIVEKLQGNPLFGYVHLMKSERGPVSELASLLDE